jgi:hypothetical protein
MDIIDKIFKRQKAAIYAGNEIFAPEASGTEHFFLGDFSIDKRNFSVIMLLCSFSVFPRS